MIVLKLKSPHWKITKNLSCMPIFLVSFCQKKNHHSKRKTQYYKTWHLPKYGTKSSCWWPLVLSDSTWARIGEWRGRNWSGAGLSSKQQNGMSPYLLTSTGFRCSASTVLLQDSNFPSRKYLILLAPLTTCVWSMRRPEKVRITTAWKSVEPSEWAVLGVVISTPVSCSLINLYFLRSLFSFPEQDGNNFISVGWNLIGAQSDNEQRVLLQLRAAVWNFIFTFLYNRRNRHCVVHHIIRQWLLPKEMKWKDCH